MKGLKKKMSKKTGRKINYLISIYKTGTITKGGREYWEAFFSDGSRWVTANAHDKLDMLLRLKNKNYIQR